MKILAFSDTHGSFPIPKMGADLILLLGDIDYYDLRKIDQLYTCPKAGVLGNHDAPDYFDSTFQSTSIINGHQKVVEVLGLTIAGFEGCPRYNQRNYLQYEEETVYSFTHSLPTVDIFIAHSNPKWKDDVYSKPSHQGFLAFSDYIEQKQPSYFFHGHIHQERTYEKGKTKIVSVYPSYVFDF